MEKKRCETLLSSLSEYVDGTAQAELCREIEHHLASCEDCRVVVDTLKKTISLYHESSSEDLPTEVRERLFARLDLGDYLDRD